MHLIYHPKYSTYNFGPSHPFTPRRQLMLASLFETLEVTLPIVTPEPVDESHLRSVHQPDFIHAVKRASEMKYVANASTFGLDTGDVPIFENMHDATCLLVGGTMEAARRVMKGESNRTLQWGGGLHHANSSKASGFCVYNDLAVAIKMLRDNGMRVAYLDIDVHHGDGVQWIFYEDPNVLTISFHESGRYLFPGTGSVEETGKGPGIGFAVNVPLEPYVEDGEYLHLFQQVVPPVLEWFNPDILVVQAGADAHAKDPLAHLKLSTHGFQKLFERILAYADMYTNERVVFTLGGGYNLDATSRVWALLTLMFLRKSIPATLPEQWVDQWNEVRLQNEMHDAFGTSESSDLSIGHRSMLERLRSISKWA